MLAHQEAEAATERQACDPGAGDRTTGGGQAVQLGFPIEFSPGDAGLDANTTGCRVDTDSLHRAQVDHHAVINDRATGDVMATAAHRDFQIVLDREIEGIYNVGGSRTACDDGWTPIDHAIMHASRRLIAIIAGHQQTPRKAALKRRQRRSVNPRHREIGSLRRAVACAPRANARYLPVRLAGAKRLLLEIAG